MDTAIHSFCLSHPGRYSHEAAWKRTTGVDVQWYLQLSTEPKKWISVTLATGWGAFVAVEKTA